MESKIILFKFGIKGLRNKSIEVIRELSNKYDISFEETLMIIGESDLQAEYYSK